MSILSKLKVEMPPKTDPLDTNRPTTHYSTPNKHHLIQHFWDKDRALAFVTGTITGM